MQINQLTRLIPVKVSPSGKTSDRLLRIMESVFPLNKQQYLIRGTGVTVSSEIRQERLLYYYFYNILRYFRKTDLYNFLSDTAGDDKYFIDIGTNLGFYSLLAKQLGYKVIAFEPEPIHAHFLKKNSFMFDEFYQVALSNSKGAAQFYIGDNTHCDASSLVSTKSKWEDSPYQETIKVQTERLDHLPVINNVKEKIGLIKIDVEGHEESVVEGMLGLICDRSSFQIWCEVRGEESDRNPGSYKKVAQLLWKYGYAPYIFKKAESQPFEAEKHVRKVFDILFVKE